MFPLLILVPVVVLALLTLLLFPVVGIALIPVVAVVAAAGIGWLWITLTRGPRALPERRTPGEQR